MRGRAVRAALWGLAALTSAAAVATAQDGDDAGRAGTFRSGKWEYRHTVSGTAGAAQGRAGLLLYDGKAVEPGDLYDYVKTPWGEMFWWGAQRDGSAFAGWLLLTPPGGKRGDRISPDGSTDAADAVDIARSGTYASGRWRFEVEIESKGTAAETTQGKLFWMDKPVKASAARDYVKTPWGVMYFWGDKPDRHGLHGWLPKVPAGLPGQLVNPAAGAVEKVDPDKSGTYTLGNWRYALAVRGLGTRSEARDGALIYSGRTLRGARTGDFVKTPWGTFWWWGARSAAWGNEGWLPLQPNAEPGRELDPAAEAARIDLARSGSYQAGGWKLVLLVWGQPGAPSGAYGRLVQKGSEVRGGEIGQALETPWGTLWWWGDLEEAWGRAGWLPVRPEAEAIRKGVEGKP